MFGKRSSNFWLDDNDVEVIKETEPSFETYSLKDRKRIVLEAIRYVERKYKLPTPHFSPDEQR